MKFSYRRFLVELDGEPEVEIYRPIVPILIRGPKATLQVRPLLDCGADFTLFPLSVARAVGIEPDEDRVGTVGGIEGGALAAYPAQAELEMTDGVQVYRWPATVRFASGNNLLLGHLGFLEFFTAALDHFHRQFSLEPNECYPGVIVERNPSN